MKKIHEPIRRAPEEKLFGACDLIAASPSKKAQVSWVSFSTTFGKKASEMHTMQVIKTCVGCLIGGKYEDLRAVKARRAAGYAPTRASSYRHDADRPYIVYGKKMRAPKPCLQVLLPDGVKWETSYFLDGAEIDPDSPMAAAARALTPKAKGGEIENVFSILWERVTEISPDKTKGEDK